jgi:hypothetical protein
MGRCVSCGGSLKPVRRYSFKSDAFRRVYSDRHVYSCVECGLSQTDVSKVNEGALSGYYRAEYRAVAQIGVGDPGHRWYRARATALAMLVAEHLSRSAARVFELGAGYGYNLLAVKELFPAAQLFTDELDETVTLPETIDRAELSKGIYDVVILSHVLEHFADPKRLIRSALNALALGGIVIIEVPNDVPGIFPLNGPDEPTDVFHDSGAHSPAWIIVGVWRRPTLSTQNHLYARPPFCVAHTPTHAGSIEADREAAKSSRFTRIIFSSTTGRSLSASGATE